MTRNEKRILRNKITAIYGKEVNVRFHNFTVTIYSYDAEETRTFEEIREMAAFVS